MSCSESYPLARTRRAFRPHGTTYGRVCFRKFLRPGRNIRNLRGIHGMVEEVRKYLPLSTDHLHIVHALYRFRIEPRWISTFWKVAVLVSIGADLIQCLWPTFKRRICAVHNGMLCLAHCKRKTATFLWVVAYVANEHLIDVRTGDTICSLDSWKCVQDVGSFCFPLINAKDCVNHLKTKDFSYQIL